MLPNAKAGEYCIYIIHVHVHNSFRTKHGFTKKPNNPNVEGNVTIISVASFHLKADTSFEVAQTFILIFFRIPFAYTRNYLLCLTPTPPDGAFQNKRLFIHASCISGIDVAFKLSKAGPQNRPKPSLLLRSDSIFLAT